ncbi:MAG TPA: hypothetical protein VFK85_16035 [Anaeromyxobacteraceae bacterium]|nr:hypothetical protein [Anaeromyxobacteraceae bacterium]
MKRLRRPTVAVWLLDALARERPDDLSALFAAGDRLRQAQVRALRGDAGELREATSALRDALDRLLGAVPAIAAAGLEREVGAGLLGELEGALRAVATADVDARADLQEGVLDRLPEAGGMELLGGLAPVRDLGPAPRERHDRSAARGRASDPEQRTRSKPAAAARDRAEERSRKAAEREERAAAQRRDRERRRAGAEAERLERAQRTAEERLRAARRDLEDAREREDAARRAADEARDKARAARQRAETLERDSR